MTDIRTIITRFWGGEFEEVLKNIPDKKLKKLSEVIEVELKKRSEMQTDENVEATTPTEIGIIVDVVSEEALESQPSEETENAEGSGTSEATPGQHEIAEPEERSIGIETVTETSATTLSDDSDRMVLMIQEQFSSIRKSLDGLKLSEERWFEKEALIKELHSELQEYKNDLYKKIISPMVNELISLADKVRSNAPFYPLEYSPEEAGELYRRVRQEYVNLGLQVDDILYNFDIEPYYSTIGDAYNAKKQKALKVIPTMEKERDGTVAGIIRQGYMDESGKIIRMEVVSIYKYN